MRRRIAKKGITRKTDAVSHSFLFHAVPNVPFDVVTKPCFPQWNVKLYGNLGVKEVAVDIEDEELLGCLGFVSSSADSPVKPKRSHENTRKRQNKADITKATPGAYITDQETQNAYKAQMKEKELMRESEKLDLGKLRNQYGRMRRLQQKAMLVFNNDDFKDDSVRRPPSAINHLFVDVNHISPPKNRYRRPSNFPALKAPSKPKSSLNPVREKLGKVIHENYDENESDILFTNSHENNNEDSNEKLQKARKDLLEDFSISRPYVAHEVQVLSENHDNPTTAMTDVVESTAKPLRDSISQHATVQNSLSQLTLVHRKGDTIEQTDMKSMSLLYRVDKTAMYPSNFNPFPQRNSKRKTLTGK